MNIHNKLRVSTKHLLIDKANTVILYSAAATVAIIAFAIVATNTLAKTISYQRKVISARDKASSQLASNIKAVDTIMQAYQTFESAKESVIGTADKNPKIILDALPSKYDFPALTTSLEALVKNSGLKLGAISGVDNETTAVQSSVNPQPIEITFEISATGALDNVKILIDLIERSIRPIKISSIALNAAGSSDVQVSISAMTYYQPEMELDTEQQIVPVSGILTKKENSGDTQ